MGSNPIQGTVRNVSAGHWRASVAVTHPRFAVQVRLLPDTLQGGLVAQLAERLSLKQEDVGSIPTGATL